MIDSQTIGLFFRETREQANLSLAEIAQMLEITEAELEAFESGAGLLGVDDLFALTNILNIDPDAVLAQLQPAAVAAVEADVEQRLREAEAQAEEAAKLAPKPSLKISGAGGMR